MKILFSLVCLFLSFGAAAATRSNTNCEPGRREPRGSCIDAICSKGGFTCSFEADFAKVSALCKASYAVDGACIDTACSEGGFICSFERDLTRVAELCRGVDDSCVASACRQGAYTCGFESDLTRVLEQCRDSRAAMNCHR